MTAQRRGGRCGRPRSRTARSVERSAFYPDTGLPPAIDTPVSLLNASSMPRGRCGVTGVARCQGARPRRADNHPFESFPSTALDQPVYCVAEICPAIPIPHCIMDREREISYLVLGKWVRQLLEDRVGKVVNHRILCSLLRRIPRDVGGPRAGRGYVRWTLIPRDRQSPAS